MAADDELLKKVNRIFCDEIRNYLRKKARRLGVKGGETGIVSYLQRAGGALNLNLHYHLLVLGGLYTTGEGGEAIFTRIPGIHNDELARVVRGVSRRVIKYLRKAGRLSEDGEEVFIGDASDEYHEALSHMKRASISSRIALGPRAGLRVRRIGSSFGFEEEVPKSHSYGCVSMNGFSIHAATSIKPPFSIHTDLDAMLAEFTCKGFRSELSTLVCIKVFRHSISRYSFSQSINTEACLHRI